MRTKILSAVFATGFLFSAAAGTAMAGQADAPGTPGDKNCAGQTTAYLAQASKEQLDAPGIGNLADFNELSVKEVKAVVEAFCAAP